MKRVILAAAVLVGCVGTANAVPINSSTVEIWNGASGGTANDPRNQGLPSTAEGGTNPLPLIAAQATFVAPISSSLAGPDPGASSTIADFFAADTPSQSVPSTCTGACPGATLSAGNFTTASLFEFEFTITQAGTLAVTHDDGVSLFAQGNVANNFLPGCSAPTFSVTCTSGVLQPGTYDLWYAAANGDPEVLTTNFTYCQRRRGCQSRERSRLSARR